MKLIVPLRKPRNPVVIASLQRRAGAHRRTASALRQQARRALRDELAHPSP